MTLEQFFDDFKFKSSYATDLAIRHILEKKYKSNDTISQADIVGFLSDYNHHIIHLNDFGFAIYKQHNTSIDEIYKECMNIFELDYDNQSYYNYHLTRLSSKINALSNIEDKDLLETLKSNIANDTKELEDSKYYLHNRDELKEQLEELKSQC